MQPALGSKSTPSLCLLRYLRHQANGLCIFTGSPTASSSRISQSDRRCNSAKSSASIRPLTTTRSRREKVTSDELSFGKFEGGPVVAHESNILRGFVLSRSPQTRSSRDSPTRRASTISRPLLKRLWKQKGDRNGDNGKEADHLPPLPSFLDDAAGTSLGRNKGGKPGSELKLRCTEIDENGNVTTVNGEFKKSELIAKYGLLPRDLRKIDSSLLPHILVRPSAILINLLHLRVLIKHNCVLVLDAYGSTDSFAQSQFMYDLSGKLSQKDSRQAGSLPYEFRALEAVLISVTTGLEGEFEGVSEPVVRVLRELEEDIDRDKLRHLLVYSKRLGTFEQKARLVRDAIDDLLEADDDLVTMYLTERAQGKIREEDDHTEVEMLLESYHKVCDEIVQVSGNLVSNIRNTEEIVKAILDANRNSLMLLDLKFSIGTLGIGSGAFVASLYGMNLKNFIEESDLGFLGVTGWSFLFALAVCSYGLKKLRRVQRVSMWGERGKGERGSWRDVSGPVASRIQEAEARRERVERLKRLGGMNGWQDEKAAEALLPVVKEKR